jgi:hypothetical protein
MNTPKTPEELALHIEGLVAAYVNEAQRVVQHALVRSFSRSGGGPDKTTRAKPARTRQQGPRRTPAQLAELADRLAAAISEQPGQSMALFAGQLGVPVRDLHRPMTMLKDQRRIRSVGRRQATRYFPTAHARAGG